MSAAEATYPGEKGSSEQERQLIEAAKKDASRFGILYKQYFEQIFLFVLKRVESEDLAADVTSQVFLKALLNLPKYRDMGFPFSSWLYRIARNEMYDRYRSEKLQMVVSLERGGVLEMIAEMNERNEENYSGLYEALELLEDNEMELIELRFFEKRPFREIGEILEITENNAKVRTYRVLDKLKNQLKHESKF